MGLMQSFNHSPAPGKRKNDKVNNSILEGGFNLTCQQRVKDLRKGLLPIWNLKKTKPNPHHRKHPTHNMTSVISCPKSVIVKAGLYTTSPAELAGSS
ncbi:hypothetical protein EB241_09825 [Erwinia psidii]|uniref:Uncharacterized protein n=1 Tax=Erwinia psidii TaxID=69224 RepID=A0A3N6RZ79_9GAMM|nr:hypothetical protein EB241_09825 [Erwinia psidii]